MGAQNYLGGIFWGAALGTVRCLVVALKKMYMRGSLTCPFCDDSPGHTMRMCAAAAPLNKRRLLLAAPGPGLRSTSRPPLPLSFCAGTTCISAGRVPVCAAFNHYHMRRRIVVPSPPSHYRGVIFISLISFLFFSFLFLF